MDFCWELVCYRLSGTDVGHVLQTCSARINLAKRNSLWIRLLSRDFPEHLALLQAYKEHAREYYQDLYQFGGYYFLKQNEISIYPDRPVCMYVDHLKRIRKAVTYRTPGDNRLIRYPHEDRFAWEDSHRYNKVERKKLLEGKCLPLRAMPFGADLVIVSRTDIAPPTGMHLFVPATRIPFSTGIDELEKWIFLNFHVQQLSWMPREEYLRLEGCLKEGNELSSHSKTLLVFKTCGEGGGLVGGKPCKSPVSASSTAKHPVSPYYGRCHNHPREKDDPHIWKHKHQTFKTEWTGGMVFVSTFVFNKEAISVFSGGVSMSKKFTHLNGESLENLLKGWVEKNGKLEKYRLVTK